MKYIEPRFKCRFHAFEDYGLAFTLHPYHTPINVWLDVDIRGVDIAVVLQIGRAHV